MSSQGSLQRAQRIVLGLLMLSSFLMPLVAYSIGPLAPFLRAALALTREQIGVLTSLFFGGAALACGLATWATDHWGIRRFFVAAQIVAGLPLLAMPLAPTYGGLCLAAGLAGLGFGTNTGVTSKALTEWFPSASRATAFGAKLLAFSSDGNFWRVVMVGFLFGSAQFAFVTYLALFLYESWGLSALLAAGLLAQAQLVAAACRIPAGWVSDRWLGGERRTLMRGFGLLGVAAMLILLLLPQGTAYPVLILGVLLYGIGGLSWGNTYMAMVSEVPRAAKGLGIGLGNAAPHTGGMLIASLFGRVADMTGSYTLAWGMIMGCLLVAVGILGWVRTEAQVSASSAPVPPTPLASAD